MSETGLLTMHEVLGLTTFSRPAFYRLITAGQFPQPLKLGQFKIAFRQDEIRDTRARATRPRRLLAVAAQADQITEKNRDLLKSGGWTILEITK